MTSAHNQLKNIRANTYVHTLNGLTNIHTTKYVEAPFDIFFMFVDSVAESLSTLMLMLKTASHNILTVPPLPFLSKGVGGMGWVAPQSRTLMDFGMVNKSPTEQTTDT